MKINRDLIKRPKCEHCGNHIRRIRKWYSGAIGGEIPDYCPTCGERISTNIQVNMDKHKNIQIGLICSYFIIVFIIAVIVLSNLNSK
ncbi:MAG: hypothetical protein ACFFCV_18685 [Promethearchaeota archaeon]